MQLSEKEREMEPVLLSVDVKELDDDTDDDDVHEVVKVTEEEREGVTDADEETVRDGDFVLDTLFVEERVCVKVCVGWNVGVRVLVDDGERLKDHVVVPEVVAVLLNEVDDVADTEGDMEALSDLVREDVNEILPDDRERECEDDGLGVALREGVLVVE